MAFDGTAMDRGIKWYTDPGYQYEYDVRNGGVILNPDEFEVDTTIVNAPTADGKNFQIWKLWGGNGYAVNGSRAAGEKVDLGSPGTNKTWHGVTGIVNNVYTILASDADIEGTIIVANYDPTPISQHYVTKVDSSGNRTTVLYESPISLGSPGDGLVWKTKNRTLDSNTYTLNASDSDYLGNIVIKAVKSDYAPTSFVVKTVKDGYNPGSDVILKSGANDKNWKGDGNNYYYVFEAVWTQSTTKTYKVVYASNYGDLSENLVPANVGDSITLKSLTASGKTFNGWKVWNTGASLTGSKTVSELLAIHPAIDGYILLVADWGEDVTNANNVVYASEFGSVPNMDSVRKYQFMSTRNLSLYAHTGTYVIYVHDFYGDPSKTLQYELREDEHNQITLPVDHHGLGNYLFLGWSSHVNAEDGKREYTYIPGEHVWVSALPETLDLYPFYVSDGSDIRYYNGEEVRLELHLDEVLGEKQHLTIGDAAILKVRYDSQPIEDFEHGSKTSSVTALHAGDYEVYYYAMIKTPKGLGHDVYGNTETGYTFPGHSTLKIMKVDAYAIAPSAYIREKEGKIIVSSDPANITLLDESSGNIVLTKDDIQFVGLVEGDVASTRLYTSEADKETGMGRTVLEDPSQLIIKPIIVFTNAESEFANRDYNLNYIDGSLLVYPEESSKHESEGYI